MKNWFCSRARTASGSLSSGRMTLVTDAGFSSPCLPRDSSPRMGVMPATPREFRAEEVAPGAAFSLSCSSSR